MAFRLLESNSYTHAYPKLPQVEAGVRTISDSADLWGFPRWWGSREYPFGGASASLGSQTVLDTQACEIREPIQMQMLIILGSCQALIALILAL
jgi:hypothetical protein